MLRVGFEPTTRGLSTRGLCQLGYHSAIRHHFPLNYRRQDSNLQPPESESGASCQLGYCGARARDVRADVGCPGESNPRHNIHSVGCCHYNTRTVSNYKVIS